MTVEQLQLFQSKSSFRSELFEAEENTPIFKKIGESITEAFNEFSSFPISKLDNTTRSNILNNLVIRAIDENCSSERFEFHSSLTYTRRAFGILDDSYILFFKKFPVSNIKTNQDELIKNQQLGKHNLFVSYHIDEFWNSVTKLEIVYFSSPSNVTYSFDISEYLENEVLEVYNNETKVPSVKLKKDIVLKKKA